MDDKLTKDIIGAGIIILMEFGRELKSEDGDTKDRIPLNFLARTLRQLLVIQELVQGEFISDAWIIYRSLLERYFLFVYLCQARELEVFDDWCFKKMYEWENKIRSSEDLKDKPEMKNRNISAKQTQRYSMVSQDSRVLGWKRPKMEEIAKQMNLTFLYYAGYQHASGYVHPISTDGLNDYLCLMNRVSKADDSESAIILRNSRLITLLHMQHFMNQPEYNWRRIMYDLLDQLFGKMKDCQLEYSQTFQKVQALHQSGAGLLNKTGCSR